MPIEPAVFEAFETDHSLFEIEVGGTPVWERVRFQVFREINRQQGLGEGHASAEFDVKNALKGCTGFLKNLFVRNPFLSESRDVLFVGHQRRKKDPDGYWWDLYCDPIHDACHLDYVHFERPHLLEHKHPARTGNLRYLDLVSYGGEIQRRLRVKKPTIPNPVSASLRAAERSIDERFDADVDLVSVVRSNLHARNTKLWMYRRLLDRIDPRIVVLVVGYGRETLVEACRERSIPVVELQHGVIHEGHLGYSYPNSRVKETFPDYLLTFGDYWADTVEFPIPDDRLLTVGYPYLERFVRRYSDTSSSDQILFVSQGPIGDRLSKFALRVADHPSIDSEIVYKLHPGESEDWQERYPWLVDADVKVVDDSDRELYRLFAESRAQVGVSSTAVYEGLCFDLETFVYDCPGAEFLRAPIERGAAKLVGSADELASSLGSPRDEFAREYFFASNAIDRTCEALDKLLAEGTSRR